MTIEEQIEYWVNIAEHDIPVMKSLYENGHYVYCLYIGHLILEKIIKAHYVKENHRIPPKTHDLVRLINKTSLKPDEGLIYFLDELTDFQMETRYPDYKMELYKIANKELTTNHFNKILEVYKWLKFQL